MHVKKNDIVIAICDDESYILDRLKLLLTEYRMNSYNGNNIVIRDYGSSSTLILDIVQVDILFIDIEMPKPDGFEVAEEIRKLGLNIKIIFVTNHREYIQQAFKVNAFRFLYKPFFRDAIVEVMEEAMEDLVNAEVVFSGINYIKVRDIYYIEALGDGTAIHKEDNNIITSKSLKYWEQKLGVDFYRCHKTYLISFRHIISLKDHRALMVDDIELPVAIRKWQDMKKSYNNYIKRKSRII